MPNHFPEIVDFFRNRSERAPVGGGRTTGTAMYNGVPEDYEERPIPNHLRVAGCERGLIKRPAILLTNFAALLIFVLTMFHSARILDDPFHYGEYFAAAVSFFSDSNPSIHPLTIHGALDYIPALVAEYLWGHDHYFFPAYTIYKILSVCSMVLLLLISSKIAKSRPYSYLVVLAVAALAPLSVGYRDLFLLASIYLFFEIVDGDSSKTKSFFLQLIFGITVALGLFWSYDRGIAGALSLGLAILILAFRKSWYALSLVSFFLSVLILGALFENLSIKNYLADIYYLVQTSSQWGYGLKTQPIMLSLFAAALNATSIFILVAALFNSKSRMDRLPIIVFLIALSGLMLKIGINRADLGHIYFACWVPMLIALYFCEECDASNMEVGVFSGIVLGMSLMLTLLLKSYGVLLAAGLVMYITIKFEKRNGDLILKSCFGLLVFSCLGVISYATLMNFHNGWYGWIKNMAPPPDNRSSVPESIVWVADRLNGRGVECVFDLSNSGLINGLLRLPSCSRFTYPVYAGPSHENILISDLDHASPRAIVYSSTHWSYSIDGRDMKARFPMLDQYILARYPQEECNFGYCIRYKEDANDD